MDEIMYIKYNSSNKDRARYNRTHQTKAEQLVRWIIRKKQLWYIFLRQKMINSFILDFYCSKLLLWVEIDGKSHEYNQSYDIQRDKKIWDVWIKIIRYKNEDVYNNIEWIRESIVEEIQIRYKELYF